MKNKIINLTQDLISIPSWVDNQTNEIKINQFIFNYLKQNSQLTVVKQKVNKGRFNILASNSTKIQTLIIGHTDTVGINQGWTTDPIKPIIKNGKLFGRGATDMKSGLAAMILLACQKKLPDNLGFLFYVDEEYNFVGIKKFINDFGTKIKPKSIISLDGSELKIANGCRGLIEISATIGGVSCHAATPQNGINAIEVATKSIEKLKDYLSQFKNPELGNTTINLALIQGGKAANVVPDSCQIILDIRPSKKEINANFIIKQLKLFISQQGGNLIDFQIKFNFGSWLTPKSKLINLGLNFKEINSSGFIDIQLLWQAFKQPKCLTIGAGTQGTAHTSNEYVEIKKLIQLETVLSDIIKKI